MVGYVVSNVIYKGFECNEGEHKIDDQCLSQTQYTSKYFKGKNCEYSNEDLSECLKCKEGYYITENNITCCKANDYLIDH